MVPTAPFPDLLDPRIRSINTKKHTLAFFRMPGVLHSVSQLSIVVFLQIRHNYLMVSTSVIDDLDGFHVVNFAFLGKFL